MIKNTLIKCQGKKTRLAEWILSSFPNNIKGIYYEPFLGSGSIAFNLCHKKSILSDINPHIIKLYSAIKNKTIKADDVRQYFEKEKIQLSKIGEKHYYKIRSRFNSEHDSLDFLFLSHHCFNGLMRFNGKGEFNVPFCKRRAKFVNQYFSKILREVGRLSKLFDNNIDWEINCINFREAIKEVKENDFVYCDPPYLGRNVQYYEGWTKQDEEDLYELLLKSGCKFVVSTWAKDEFGKNPHIKNNLNVISKTHKYIVAQKEEDRREIEEALVTNYFVDEKKLKKVFESEQKLW